MPSLSDSDVLEQVSLSKPLDPGKRRREDATPEATQIKRQKTSSADSVRTWVLDLPPQFDARSHSSEIEFEDWNGMSRSPARQALSQPSVSEDTNITDSFYSDSQYELAMEHRGSFMQDSERGLLPEELEMLEVLKTKKTILPSFCRLSPGRLSQLRQLLRNASKLRVCVNLHRFLVPSPQFLKILCPDEIQNLAEGYNDRWVDNIIFYDRAPRPDRTVAFPWSAFTEVELQKLQLSDEARSWYVANHGSLFPFFTAQVKGGNGALDTADNANTNSMTVALRAVFKLYYTSGQASKIHRRVLGFSLSHNDGSVRIYAHYPEIDGDKITFYRTALREFDYAENDAQDEETAAQFVWNVYAHFAPLHLKRLKEAIGWLPDPLAPPADPTTVAEQVENQQQQEIIGSVETAIGPDSTAAEGGKGAGGQATEED